ncbi:transglycosylase domain-containing protein [Virgibacillus siamensis]|uniref:transglycosylase domain-containing protein n=1 Tax=Virgibacillus siamensis TaxID=480071 RepID=UPI0009843848|nr:PBP1A family penicillin-binding protein [Virgibacillus siamensis]
MKKIKWLVLSFSIIIVLGLLGYAAVLFGGALVVDKEDLTLDATTTIETSDGKVIGKLYEENRIPVSIEKIPDHVQEAFVAIEDRRFFDHQGVDFRSVVRAIVEDIVAGAKVEGASTITMQLAKNLFLHNDKTWMRKTKEVVAAIHLERELSKKKILELYLNEIYFGQGVYGVEAASQFYFSKPVEDLTIAEGALLAGMAKGPNGYSPIDHPDKAVARRNLVLQVMHDTGKITDAAHKKARQTSLGLKLNETKPNPWADGYIDLVLEELQEEHDLSIDEMKRGGYRIIVNMDKEAQQTAYKLFRQDSFFPGNTEGVQGAFVLMEKTSGKIAAAIAGRDYQLGDLNHVTVKRQPGSAMKPIAVYGPAMMKEMYQPYSLIPDQKMEIDHYTATNYDDQYAGAVSIYDALVASKNAPAVWLLDQIGISYAKDYLEKMHLNIKDDGLAIALGGLSKGLTPLQMAESFRAFASGGKVIESTSINRIYNREQEVIFKANPKENKVFSPQVAWNMTEMLTQVVERGTGNAGEYGKALAGKTGSTQHPYVKGEYKDAWFVGYTPEYVSALWMGYDTSDKNHYLTAGSSYPTRLTKAILTELDKTKNLAASFTKPEKVNDLPEPIELPENINLQSELAFGGFSLFKGRLEWSSAADNRVVYHIYREQEGIDKRIGEVKGKSEFFIGSVNVFNPSSYYVVPYNPLTKVEGKKSNTVRLAL